MQTLKDNLPAGSCVCPLQQMLSLAPQFAPETDAQVIKSIKFQGMDLSILIVAVLFATIDRQKVESIML